MTSQRQLRGEPNHFQVVKHSHAVPKVYLRGWERDGRICLTLVDGSPPRDVSLRDAGVIKNLYRRTRPDSSTIYDIEWSLGHIEDVVRPLLTGLDSRWPLSLRDKATLAELFGFQLVRGAAFRDWHQGFIAASRVSLLEEALAKYPGVASEIAMPRAVARAAEQMSGDTHRLLRMLSLGHKVTAVMGSMHWTLLKFGRPLIAASDEPVVVWPLERQAAYPQANDWSVGILNALEVRVPVSARLLIVMSWRDDYDILMRGRPEHARAANGFTIANSHKGWFAEPGSSPPVSSQRFLPLSRQLLSCYDASAATASRRRQTISAQIQPILGSTPTTAGRQELSIVDVVPVI